MHPSLPTLLAVGLCLAACSKKRDFTEAPEDGSGGAAGSSNGSGGGGAGAGSGGGSNTGPCADHDCENDAACEEDGDSYTCVCPDGFEGDRCETDIDECAAEPCENGGTCSNEAGGYECECPADWAGQNCHLPRFELLPDGFTPVRLSADGTVVIGGTNYNTSTAHAARYSGGQLRDLGVYSGDSYSDAPAVSADGETIVGSSGFTSGELQGRRAIRWRGTNMTQLPKLNEDDLCNATGVTADGETIVGTCASRVVRWTADGVEDLGVPPSTMFCTKALVDANGSLLMATCSQAGDNKVFLHTSEGFTMLASQPLNCRLQDVAAGGTIATAFCGSGNSFLSFSWTPDAGVVPSEAYVSLEAVSGAGEFTVGYVLNPDGYVLTGTRWNQEGAAEDIADVLSDAGIDVGDVAAFGSVIDVSDDGKTYLGGGELDTEEEVHWVARL